MRQGWSATSIQTGKFRTPFLNFKQMQNTSPSNLRYFLITLFICCHFLSAFGQTVSSPDNKIGLHFTLENGRPFFTISYVGRKGITEVVEKSPLGIEREDEDFTRNL